MKEMEEFVLFYFILFSMELGINKQKRKIIFVEIIILINVSILNDTLFFDFDEMTIGIEVKRDSFFDKRKISLLYNDFC